MADKVTLVRGIVAGATVQTTAENAERLGAQFEPEKASAKKSTSSKSEK